MRDTLAHPCFDTAESEARYWRARAAAAELHLEDARERLLAFTAVLPAEYLALLHAPIEEVREFGPAADLFDGWDETSTLQEAHAEDELRRAWLRLDR